MGRVDTPRLTPYSVGMPAIGAHGGALPLDAGVGSGSLPTTAEVAVLGAGILGSLTALQCARRGLSVTLIESESAIWTRASLHNEGKVHLGHVYALGSAATRRTLLADALAFANDIENALGESIDWNAIRTPAFRYIVMPDSQLSVDALAARYRETDDAYRHLGMPSYLGEALDSLAETVPGLDEQSGLPCFLTAERAVDPITLRAIISDRIDRDPRVQVALNSDVRRVAPSDNGASVEVASGGSVCVLKARIVIDCRWERQGADIEGRARETRNIRVKAAVRLLTDSPVPTATLVAGPYGDLVQHRDYAYVSWYPEARLHHEFATGPSPSAERALSTVESQSVVDAQVTALRRFGWLQGNVEVLGGVGGFILGAGAHDIVHPDSLLHDRDASGLERFGTVLLPRSFKFSSAPAAARRAADAASKELRAL